MILGLTGPAGSGKSTVSNIIKNNFDKTYVIDVDRVGHDVLTLSFVQDKLKDTFGSSIFKNDEINRKELGKIVFKDENKLNILNSIVHPAMFNKIETFIKKDLKNYDIIIIDAALLFKIKLHTLCDKIIFVDADEKVRIKRLTQKRALTLDKALSIVQSQKNLDFGPHDIEIKNNYDDLKYIKKIIFDLIKP
ncbi:MAG: dephospho-CoA kinase [Oceanotoga sp.]|jgi:dephospho-CoA kinase|uniref:dephospho-CoA kinase n=1 Tax=Oceanotoga sp. TaxID=2108366 RepID=UPI00264EEB40|nr:dephospho-CoA kinase [Oceanotoga sp.]MDN5341689.1 dephospho-CoA kinase [Oceanotoga sp.]